MPGPGGVRTQAMVSILGSTLSEMVTMRMGQRSDSVESRCGLHRWGADGSFTQSRDDGGLGQGSQDEGGQKW